MNSRFTIALEGITLRGNHGLYDFEKENGNTFTVNIKVKAGINPEEVNKIKDTVDYEKLYEIVEEEMRTPSDLLEEVAVRIARKTLDLFTPIEWVKVVLVKNDPPLKGTTRAARIAIKLKK